MDYYISLAAKGYAVAKWKKDQKNYKDEKNPNYVKYVIDGNITSYIRTYSECTKEGNYYYFKSSYEFTPLK